MIAVDPGNSTGWACFESGTLVACGLLADDACGVPCAEPGPVVIERPTIYPHSPVPPNDIVALAITAGSVAARLGGKVEWVLPRRWKGTVPGDIMTQRILEALTPEETAVYLHCSIACPRGVRHNIVDAIGLGLYWLRRLPK